MIPRTTSSVRLIFASAILEFIQNSKKSFIFGKTRVAMMKALSIHTLELQAALLATRLKDDILKPLTVEMHHVFTWIDSTTVFHCLNSNDKLPVFVANRVSEILKSTTIDEWFYVMSGDNPADTGTRWMSSEALKDSSGVIGPNILRTTDWPFLANELVIIKFCLKFPSCDVDNCLETSFSLLSPKLHPSKILNTDSIGKVIVPLRGIK